MFSWVAYVDVCVYGFPTHEAEKNSRACLQSVFKLQQPKAHHSIQENMKLMSEKMFGSEILFMAKQRPCKESKFDNGMAHRKSYWRN